MTERTPDQFDYIIIGGGSAGCVVAGRLSEDAQVRVLLLERGVDVIGNPRVAINNFTEILSGLDMAFLPVEVLHTFEPKLQTGFSRTYTPRALGGGPSISGAFWGRGDPANYDEWARLGNDGWSYSELLPYFKKSESFKSIFHPEREVSPDRGNDGPIKVMIHADDLSIDPLIDAAIATFGTRRIPDYSTSLGQEGFSLMQRTLGHNKDAPVRSSSYTGYIEPYVDARQNLSVVDEATVVRIHFNDQGNRAERVEYLHQGKTRYATATREIILSAGTINSPKILLHSGVGDRATLTALGIIPVVDLPGVGENLHDHLFLPFRYQLAPGVMPKLTVPSSACIGFLKSLGSDRIDIEIAWQVLQGEVLHCRLVNLRNESVGSVRLESADPLLPPQITFNLDPQTADMDKSIAFCRKVRAWLLVSRLGAAEITPGLASVPMDATDEQWRSFVSQHLSGWFHMAGTCRMGPASEPMSVVDARLRVHGVSNLRIADCSIMPRVVTSHPSATAIMIGEKVADLIKAEAQH